MSLQLTVKLISKEETQVVGQNNFRKRLMIGETIEQYPQQIPFEFHHDAVDFLNDIAIGTEIKVTFNIKCKAWIKPGTTEPKYFPTMNGYRID